ncbi:MAG TPA: ribonuclease P [candidate division Zixibacteria bacterium]|nr:ribonuclease P [candidate division Zixibacteria bacterium]
MNRKKENETTKKIALERIEILLLKADQIYSEDAQLAQNYGERARKIAMKAKIKIPQKWKIRYCNKCKTFLYPGINSHTRTKSGKPSRVITYCDLCGKGARSKVLSN